MSAVNNYYRYEMFCETEGKNVVTIISSSGTPTAPTTCPNDAGHTVTSSSINLANISYRDKIIIDENERQQIDTNGYYHAENVTVIVNGESEVSKNVTYPFNICLFDVSFQTHPYNIGDQIIVSLNPDTSLGTPTSSVSASATVISVLASQLKNIKPGFFIKLQEGGTTDDLGRVVSVDWPNLQFTVETATTNSFTTSASILLTAEYCNIVITNPRKYSLGKAAIGGTFVPKNSIIEIKYKNLSTGSKELDFLAEYTY